MTAQELQAKLDEMDDGILRSGAHTAGGREFCALEFESQVRGRGWSDAPITLPDLRPINDAPWSSDRARTAALLPVMSALWDWGLWTPARRRAWASHVALETVRQIVSALPGLPPDRAQRCRDAADLPEAAEAAWAAAAAAEAAEAAWAAEAAEAAMAAWAAAAAWAAMAAARAAAQDNDPTQADRVLRLACQIWIDAAEATS